MTKTRAYPKIEVDDDGLGMWRFINKKDGDYIQWRLVGLRTGSNYVSLYGEPRYGHDVPASPKYIVETSARWGRPDVGKAMIRAWLGHRWGSFIGSLCGVFC